MNTPATTFALTLPGWLLDALGTLPASVADDAAAMELVNALAARNHLEGNGGPFAAIVTERDTGALVSVGVNVVLSSGISAAHAEVMALSLAQARLGRWDLGDPSGPAHTLVVNWRTCVMCGGAALWSGVARIVIAGEGPELEDLTGFDEGPAHPQWIVEMERRGIEVSVGTGRDAAIDVFRAYGARSDAVVYNAGGARPGGSGQRGLRAED